MRLFVVRTHDAFMNPIDAGAEGRYTTLTDFQQVLQANYMSCHVEQTRALDEALLAMIGIAHVGMVIPFRLGWVFIAEDASR